MRKDRGKSNLKDTKEPKVENVQRKKKKEEQ